MVIPIERHYGNSGEVQVYYQTSPGTALPLTSSHPDYHSASGWVLFQKEEIQKSVTITLLDDDIAEGPEHFYVNLTQIQLVSPRYSIYSYLSHIHNIFIYMYLIYCSRYLLSDSLISYILLCMHEFKYIDIYIF